MVTLKLWALALAAIGALAVDIELPEGISVRHITSQEGMVHLEKLTNVLGRKHRRGLRRPTANRHRKRQITQHRRRYQDLLPKQ